MAFSNNSPRFFSKDNFDKLTRNIKKMLPVLKTSKDILQEEFGLTEIQGVGFLQDFRIYSKIKPEHWANASTFTAAGQPTQMTAIQSNNMSVYATGVVTTNNAITSGTNIYFMANGATTVANMPSLTVYEGPQGDSPARPALTQEIELPAPTEAIEAGVVDEKALLAPVQVLRELDRVPNAFTLMDIDKKAALYESVAACVRSDAGGGIKNTLKDVQRRVKARCKYRDSKEVRKFFDQFQTTSCDSIDALLDRHKHLKIGPADDFIPEMPDDALEAMVLYTKMCVKVTGEKPCFYLIAPDKEFKKKKEVRQKRDPILLVQAPFGFYWQILGAWSHEMLLLEEI